MTTFRARRRQTRFCARTNSALSPVVPVYIPKVYDGRNKSFFMANYEGWRITNGARQVHHDAQPGDPDGRLLG